MRNTPQPNDDSRNVSKKTSQEQRTQRSILFEMASIGPCIDCYLLAQYLLELTWRPFSGLGRRGGGLDGFFVRFGRNYYWPEDPDPDPTPKEADIPFIRQSPVYNFEVSDWSEIGQ